MRVQAHRMRALGTSRVQVLRTVSSASSVPKEWLSDRFRKDVVQVEVQLRNDSSLAAAARVHGNHRLDPELNRLTRPQNAGADRARRPACSTVERRREIELDDGGHAVERRSPAHVLHERLKIGNAVLQREAPDEVVRIPVGDGVAFVVDAGHGGARRDRYSKLARQRERPKEGGVLGKIAKTLAEEDAGGDG